eukprot:m.306786 g.306786  ORF g.306786 m.306786 type:complete len:217 (+) comp41583_c0_seq1:588-1238(+)
MSAHACRNSVTAISMYDQDTKLCSSEAQVVETASFLADAYIDDRIQRQQSHRRSEIAQTAAEPTAKLTAKFFALAREVERRHNARHDEMCKRMKINESTAFPVFRDVANELFSTGINWGRIVALYSFAGALGQRCVDDGMPEIVPRIKKWLVRYVQRNLAEWIVSQSGWDGYERHFKNVNAPERPEESGQWKRSLVDVGLAVIGISAIAIALSSQK